MGKVQGYHSCGKGTGIKMITKLRRNFILVAMCSMAAVLAVIVGTLNLVSYLNMVTKADNILELLAENDAAFPVLPGKMEPVDKQPAAREEGQALAENQQEQKEEGQELSETLQKQREEGQGLAETLLEQKEDPGKRRASLHIQGMSPETPFETRYFSVKLDRTGQVTLVDTGKIAAVETEDAVEFAEEILESGRKHGFYDSYRYQVVTEEDSVMILFVDRSRELASFQTLVLASVSMSVLGMLAVFLLVLFFSKKVFHPVAASYEKQKQFITDASHELKTPLTIISANVEVLEMELADAEMEKPATELRMEYAREQIEGEEYAEKKTVETVPAENTWIKSIKNQIARLTVLVEQLVTLSRMDENNELKEAGDFSLSDAVQETVELFCQPAERKGISLETDVQENANYHGEEKLIRQMVSLLVDNAVKYSPKGGNIKVTLSAKGKHYQLTVRNTTEEIPRGNLDILFERFYRLDSSRNSGTGGSGIGLSIVKSIVEAHKGRISARSEDGKSLTIVVVL